MKLPYTYAARCAAASADSRGLPKKHPTRPRFGAKVATSPEQSAQALLRGDRIKDDDEGGSRPGDVEARAAGERNDRAGDEGRVKSVLRRHPGSDGQSQ